MGTGDGPQSTAHRNLELLERESIRTRNSRLLIAEAEEFTYEVLLLRIVGGLLGWALSPVALFSTYMLLLPC
jgi:hypothetical protein